MHGFEERGIAVARGRFVDTGRFGRMFPELRSLKEIESGDPNPDLTKRKSGVDFLADHMNGPSADNPRIKAGYTFLGQFIDHDLTLDATSTLEQQVDLNATTNFRTPAFELDSIYGRGPGASPMLYDPADRGHFILERNNNDLPRVGLNSAVIGDPRNDENRIIGQIHVLFLKFHNAVIDLVRREPRFASRDIHGKDFNLVFEEAQRRVRWHYQWIVLNEFLVRTVGAAKVAEVIRDTPRVLDAPDFMPVEFSGASYRFGHSQIRGGYTLNAAGGGAIFGVEGRDLRGGTALTDGSNDAQNNPTRNLVIDWSNFFGKDAPQQSMKIDTQLAAGLFTLPSSVVSSGSVSLAARNLQRGLDLSLPGAQAIADRLSIPKLTDLEIWGDAYAGNQDLLKTLGTVKNPSFTRQAPLWFYVLKEAELKHDGHRLGALGGHIVAQTFVNLLLADKASFLWQNPTWTPELPGDIAGRFTFTDLIKVAMGPAAPALKAEDVTALPDKP